MEVCKQQRRRPACTFAQTDQRLCYTFFTRVIYKLDTSESSCFKLVSGAGFKSHVVVNPEESFCRVEAHYYGTQNNKIEPDREKG